MDHQHTHIRRSIHHDLQKISFWAASLSVHCPHPQARFILIHAKRRYHMLPEEHRDQEFIEQLDKLIELSHHVEKDWNSRVKWAELAALLSHRVKVD